jgi:hypothetical protein
MTTRGSSTAGRLQRGQGAAGFGSPRRTGSRRHAGNGDAAPADPSTLDLLAEAEASKPYSLSYLLAYPGEGEGEDLPLQFQGDGPQCVAGADVGEVHRLCVHKHVLRWRAARGQRGLQGLASRL